jgi:hypothetical protein
LASARICVRNPRDDLGERTAVLRERLIEPRGHLVRRTPWRHRTLAAACGIEVFSREADQLRCAFRRGIGFQLAHHIIDHLIPAFTREVDCP